MTGDYSLVRNFRVVRSRNDNAALNVAFRSSSSSAGFVPLDDNQALFDFFLAEEFDFGFRTVCCQNADKPGTWQQKCQQQKREGNPVAFSGV